MVQLETDGKTSSYTGARFDVADMVGRDRRDILDVGSSTGALGALLKARQFARVTGIEFDERTASAADSVLDRSIHADLNVWANVKGQLGAEAYDVIICADVLEHLLDPWQTLVGLVTHLRQGGEVVISLPNVGHLNTLWNVFFRQRFPRRDRGVHDETHLRWFAYNDVLELVASAGLQVCAMQRSYRFTDRPKPINRYAKFFARLPGLKNLLTYQFLIRAELRRSDARQPAIRRKS